MRYPKRVTMVEVGLRDGIQVEPAFIPTNQKLALAQAITSAGITELEVTSFVHPQVIPQMADAEAMVAGLNRQPHVRYAALVPNLKGAVRAITVSVDEVRFVMTVSETFNGKNVRMSIRESLAQMAAVASACRDAPYSPRFLCCLGTAFGCPYEGAMPLQRVLDLVGEFVATGAMGVVLADTTGMANPVQVAQVVGAVQNRWPDLEITLHFHNTRGMGLANVLGGLEAGISRYEASLGGLGGCPFAPRATGNICTEDTVHMLHEMGIATGVDLEALISASMMLQNELGRELPGQVMKSGPRYRLHPANEKTTSADRC